MIMSEVPASTRTAEAPPFCIHPINQTGNQSGVAGGRHTDTKRYPREVIRYKSSRSPGGWVIVADQSSTGGVNTSMRGVILLCADVNVERSTATTQGSICYGAFKLVLLRKLCDALADCVEKLGDPKGGPERGHP